ncbi:protein YgfX [Microbulbifer celer]|uniref:Protein YgfX n=1 Tax=Microbulbifer celer TaxID=435905 RepID=A0ABW3U5Y8_9GAMM|nr:protein YgfX [Microbulbifer celer]UFN58440.1 hypothetical protein LPW13_05195 [Microbulbifer celer]
MTTPACRNNPSHQNAPRAHPERSARLSCNLAPSLLLRGLLALAALQSITFLALAGLPPGVFVLLLVAATVVVIAEYRRLNAISGRLTTRERRWFWRQGGLQREFQFRGELVLWRWLIVINGRDLDGRRVQLVLARDSVSGDDWRRLQAALRYSRAGAT